MGVMLGLLILLGVAAGVVVLTGVTALVWLLGHPPRTGLARALARGRPSHPCDLGLSCEEVVLPLSSQGKTTVAWVIPGRDPTGPTVVVSHAFGESRYSLLCEAPTLVALASRVVLVDGRGSGESSPGRNDGGRDEPKDLMAIVDALEPGGDRRAVLVGESFGAFVSLMTAARFPDRVLAVVAVSSYSRWDAPIGCLLKSLRVPRWPFVPLTLLFMRVFHGPIPTVLPLASRVRCPVLLVHGEHDPLTTIEGALELASHLREVRLVRLPTSEHTGLLSHLDPQVIHKWLTGIERPEAASTSTPTPASPQQVAERDAEAPAASGMFNRGRAWTT